MRITAGCRPWRRRRRSRRWPVPPVPPAPAGSRLCVPVRPTGQDSHRLCKQEAGSQGSLHRRTPPQGPYPPGLPPPHGSAYHSAFWEARTPLPWPRRLCPSLPLPSTWHVGPGLTASSRLFSLSRGPHLPHVPKITCPADTVSCSVRCPRLRCVTSRDPAQVIFLRPLQVPGRAREGVRRLSEHRLPGCPVSPRLAVAPASERPGRGDSPQGGAGFTEPVP